MALAAIASRRLLVVGGVDAAAFLQGLVTVDIRKLSDTNDLRAGAFLDAKGRVLHDVFIAKRTDKDGQTVFDLETSVDTIDDLAVMLSRYKLRKKVTIARDDLRKVFTVWSKDVPVTSSAVEIWFNDPRPGHVMGHRVWTNLDQPTTKNARIVSEDIYHQVRMAAGLSEGSTETTDELPFVLNYDWWPHALAFDKGCYTGQELVARTHFKGQVRKRAVPVILSTKPGTSADDLLPSFMRWTVKPTSTSFPPVKATIEPIPDVATPLGEGSILALAPGGMNLALASFKDAQSLPLPGDSFKPTHQIKLDSGEKIEVCPIRPSWWPSVESV